PGDLEEVLSATLRDADAALGRSDMPTTADRITDALAIAFHPTRHLLAEPSPLLTSPEASLAPLHRSQAVKALTEPRRDVPERSRREEASRVLVLTVDGSEIVGPLLAHYRTPEYEETGREVRYRELASIPGLTGQTD